MKKMLILFSLMGVLLLVSGRSVFAQETESGIKISVINIDFIIRNGLAFKSIREQIGKFREVFQGQIQKEEETLRTANQELDSQKTILSTEAFTDKRREFEKQLVEVQRQVQLRKGNLERVQEDAIGQIQKVLNEIVTAMANEQGISLILRQDQVVMAGPKLQITQQVLDRLDAQMPSIKVAEPAK